MQVVETGLEERRLASLEPRDTLCIGIGAGDVEAEIGEAGGPNHALMPKADDRSLHTTNSRLPGLSSMRCTAIVTASSELFFAFQPRADI